MAQKKQLCINLPQETIDAIQQLAKTEHRSDSAMGRVLIAEALARRADHRKHLSVISDEFNTPQVIIEDELRQTKKQRPITPKL